jgi:hypothetical protein
LLWNLAYLIRNLCWTRFCSWAVNFYARWRHLANTQAPIGFSLKIIWFYCNNASQTIVVHETNPDNSPCDIYQLQTHRYALVTEKCVQCGRHSVAPHVAVALAIKQFCIILLMNLRKIATSFDNPVSVLLLIWWEIDVDKPVSVVILYGIWDPACDSTKAATLLAPNLYWAERWRTVPRIILKHHTCELLQ